MMIKYKVSDVAKDFGVQSKEIIAILADHNFAGKKSATALEEPELNVIFEHYTQKHNSDNLDAYFATANDKPNKIFHHDCVFAVSVCTKDLAHCASLHMRCKMCK